MDEPTGESSPMRQQVLLLCLKTPELDAPVTAWSFYDGSGRRESLGPDQHGQPPYPDGVAALEDGWRLSQMAPPMAPPPDDVHRVSFLKHEFVFTRLVPAAG
jgi:hypothetical protein